MVRYPKKNSTYQPPEPPLPKISVPVEKKPSVVPPPQSAAVKPQQVDDTQVLELNRHIRLLEEKLKAIEQSVITSKKTLSQPIPNKLELGGLIKKYWIAGLLLLLIYPLVLGYNRWMHPMYTATVGFYVNPPDNKQTGADILVPPSVQERILRSDFTVGKAWSKAAHWPDLIGKQPWIVRPIAWAYQTRITFDKHPGAIGFVVNVRENKTHKASEFAMAIISVFKERYVHERRSRLRAALNDMDKQSKELHARLSKIIAQTNTYKPQEQCIVVSPGLKKNLDRISTDKALELEEDFARMKVQAQAYPLIKFTEKKDFDLVVLHGLLSRLTDMELKKYLVGADQGAIFEGGMQPTKARIAALINSYAADDKQLDANVLIKSAFIKTKFDALDALLNKRYGSLSSFSGRMAEYAGLKAEFEKRYTSMENLKNSREQLDRLLQGDLTAEVVVDMPVIVAKKDQ